VAIFEAVHGSAPKYAGKDVANPTAMILSGVMMLRHLGEMDAAAKVENAVIYTLAEGKTVTRDVVGDEKAAGTKAFTEAIIANLGKSVPQWKAREVKPLKVPPAPGGSLSVATENRHVIGMDVFVEADKSAGDLGQVLGELAGSAGFKLKMISNRGTQVFPTRGAETDCVDHWRCRFIYSQPNGDVPLDRVNQLLGSMQTAGLRWMHLEKLQEFNGKAGYTKAQGED
jgi:isocitrate dehydrogenase